MALKQSALSPVLSTYEIMAPALLRFGRRSPLDEITATDLGTQAVVIASLAIVTAFVCRFRSRHAAALEPNIALPQEELSNRCSR